MELLALILAGLFAGVSPAGLVGETIAADAIASQLESVEGTRVRIDAVPLHNVARGRVQKVRIALRGASVAPLAAYPDVELRIDRLEVETDAIDLDWDSLELRQPMRAGVRLVLRREDLDATLRSLVETFPTSDYDLVDPQLMFLEGDRFRFQLEVREDDGDRALIILETGVNIPAGRQIELVDPIVRVEGEDAPDRLLDDITTGLNKRLDLARLEEEGLFVRIVRFQTDGDNLDMAAIVGLERF